MGVSLQAKLREDLSRGATNELRNSGYIPAIVYGKDKEAKTVSVDNIELLKTVRDEGRNAIISLEIEKSEPVDVMLHEYQTDPVKGDVIHVDFYVVDMTEEMDVEVAVRLEGNPTGVGEGGVLQQPLYELQVRAKPRNIPEEIVIDVSELAIGESLSVADIKATGDYELIDDPETTVAVVLAPDSEEEVGAEDVDFSAEPELVGAEDEEEQEEASEE